MSNKKAEEKAEKARLKQEEKERKEREFQANLVEQFNEKQAKAKAAPTPMKKLKEWLQNPPYKCSDAKLQVRYEWVITAMCSWKPCTVCLAACSSLSSLTWITCTERATKTNST